MIFSIKLKERCYLYEFNTCFTHFVLCKEGVHNVEANDKPRWN